MGIDKSQQLRRMEIGEVMEVQEGPRIDPSVGVYRVNGQALKDGIVGWVTITGNQGITFLMPGGHTFKVKKACPLSEDLKDTTGEKTVRQLVEGETMDMVEWARTSRSALGVTRLRVKARTDDAVGWASLIDGEGNFFFEPR